MSRSIFNRSKSDRKQSKRFKIFIRINITDTLIFLYRFDLRRDKKRFIKQMLKIDIID